MSTYDIPEQPDGIDEYSNDMPDLDRAAARVARFITAFGDGVITVVGQGVPLYARDLEVLVNHAEGKTR